MDVSALDGDADADVELNGNADESLGDQKVVAKFLVRMHVAGHFGNEPNAASSHTYCMPL